MVSKSHNIYLNLYYRATTGMETYMLCVVAKQKTNFTLTVRMQHHYLFNLYPQNQFS